MRRCDSYGKGHQLRSTPQVWIPFHRHLQGFRLGIGWNETHDARDGREPSRRCRFVAAVPARDDRRRRLLFIASKHVRRDQAAWKKRWESGEQRALCCEPPRNPHRAWHTYTHLQRPALHQLLLHVRAVRQQTQQLQPTPQRQRLPLQRARAARHTHQSSQLASFSWLTRRAYRLPVIVLIGSRRISVPFASSCRKRLSASRVAFDSRP